MYALLRAGLKLLIGRGSMRSYSQFGEDALVSALFRNKKTGVYLDIGAYHPHLYSNTYALYKRGWRGVVVDPNDKMKRLFAVFRPRDTFVCAGVGEGQKAYERFEDGAYNRMREGSGIKLIPLSHFITGPVDFLNVDVEGMDVEVLRSHDWVIKPTVVAVEGPAGGEAQQFLEAQGYTLVGRCGLTLILRLL